MKNIKSILQNADSILIGAGAGLSTSAGFTYSGPRFQKYFADFEKKYGFHDMYSGVFYPYKTLEENWAYWSRYIIINRNTFYLHYNCVDDVLAEIQAKHSSEYSAIVSGIDQLKETGKLVRAFFEYMEAQDDFFKRVTCDSRFDYIRERMQNRVTKQAAESRPLKGLDQSVRNILLTFNNCVVLLYRQWVADRRKIPLEEMIELATTLLENGMKGFRG